VAEGYRGSEFQDRYFNSGSWERLTLDLPAGKEKSHWPFRIDPVTCPAVIEIAEITLKDRAAIRSYGAQPRRKNSLRARF